MAQDALYVYPKQSTDSLQIAFRILGKIAYEEELIKIDHRTGLLLFSAPYDNIQHMAFADHQPVLEQIYDTICAGENYTWNGKTYTKPGSYTDTLQNIYGCDSIVTLHLKVLPDPPITFTVNGVSFKMMRVRAGTFIMGALDDDTEAEANERPAHPVTLTRDYFIGETMLTQELWTAVMGTTIQEEEAKGTGEKNLGYGPNFPMYCLSHKDCQKFVERLNQLTGLTFRMPTEAEWEYAARGGHLSRGYKYPGSNDPHEVAWSIENDPQKKLHEVKLLKPNELGLYDMAGNVWEYIYDFRRTYTTAAQIDPLGDTITNKANIRGGSTAWGTTCCRTSYRHQQSNITKDSKAARRAFRFVLDADRVIGEDNTTYQAFGTICAGETYTWNGNTYTKPGSYTDTLTNIHGCDSIVTLHLEVLPDPPLTFTVNGVSFKMMRVRAGTFMMGATADDTGAEADEFPRHEVTLTKDYFIGETEMTQALWQAIMGDNPSEDKSNLQSPVNNVSWDDCQEMIAKLNNLTGLTFRLPTEAEWEYAARAGYYSRGYIYAGSNNIDEVAWYNKPHYASVASLKPNELGIYDMSGSVYEWCQDWYNPNFYQSPDHHIDPFQEESVDGRRCLRGGSNKTAQGARAKIYSRIANRGYQNSDTKESHVGLRLALEATGIMENNREFVTYDTICAGESYTWDANKKIYTKPGTYTDTLQNIYGCDSIVTLNLEVLPDPPLTFTVNGVSFKMMRVRAGTFMMGATPEQGTDALSDEKPAHQVTLTRDYFIGETMLTQELWTAVMGTTIQEEEIAANIPAVDRNLGYYDNYPMYTLSYNKCLEFIDKLNAMTGLTFRLPTEAEWEYAARGGQLSRGYKYPGSNNPDEVAWTNSNSDKYELHEVKLLKPNELGLYDMAGNIWEWVLDHNRPYTNEAQVNPIGDLTSDKAFIRGGSTYWEYQNARVSCRGQEHLKTRRNTRISCRLVLDADRVIGEDNTTYQAFDTICAGDTYTWNGKTYTKPGSYTDTLTNIHGCDSIVTLHLEVLPDPPITFTVNGVSFKMMRVRAGTFIMGALDDDTEAEANERPAHPVTLTRDYFIGETMLTQELWTAVMGTTIQEEEEKSSGDKGLGYGANFPMYCISYYDCLNFVERLNQLTGLTFRMPTEAEWEYAARGGHLSRGYKYPGSNDANEVAWNSSKDPENKLHVVKLLLPNELGLYDMAGNTWEWVYDYNRPYTEQSQIDPIGDTLSINAFIRGGSSYYRANHNRVSDRGISFSKAYKRNRIAFRFVLDADRVIGEDNTTYQAFDTICAGDTYTWEGEQFIESGSYTKTLQNIHGCDSIVTLHLQVNPTYETHDTIVACDSYFFNPFNEIGGV